MANVFMRNFRRFSEPFIVFCKEQNYHLQHRVKDNNNSVLGQQCFSLYVSFDENNITSKHSHFYDKNENFSYQYFIKGMAFIPAGIFSFFKSKEDAEQESELIMTIKRSVLLIQREEYNKAEQMLHVALKIAQEQQNYNGITYIYDLLANLALEQKEYNKAERLFINVMQRLVLKGAKQTDNRIVHMSLKIADIYKMQNDPRAEQGYKFCIDTLKDNIEKGDDDKGTILLYAMSLDWYAKFLVDANRLPEAFECYKKAYELNVKVNGEIHEETVVLLNDLGTICIVQDDLDSAMSYLMKAVDIGEKLPDMKDFELVLANLVALYIKKGMYEEAKKFCKKGWQNATKHNNQEVLKEITQFLDEIKQLEAAHV